MSETIDNCVAKPATWYSALRWGTRAGIVGAGVYMLAGLVTNDAQMFNSGRDALYVAMPLEAGLEIGEYQGRKMR